MVTTYQIRNVLRVYGNQLKKRTLPIKDNMDPPRYLSDTVDISSIARRKQMFNDISMDIISRMGQQNYQQVVEKKVHSDYPLIMGQEKK